MVLGAEDGSVIVVSTENDWRTKKELNVSPSSIATIKFSRRNERLIPMMIGRLLEKSNRAIRVFRALTGRLETWLLDDWMVLSQSTNHLACTQTSFYQKQSLLEAMSLFIP
jgi:hypothetical protein